MPTHHHHAACTRCTWSKSGNILRRCLSHTVIGFGQYRFRTFDEVPLAYLDWLSHQDWLDLNTVFATRLLAYIAHEPIARMIEDLFPIADTASRDETFTKQRREYMPREERQPPADLEPQEKPLPTQTNRLWLLAADLLSQLELASDPNDLFEFDFPALAHVCKLLPQAAAKLREAYRQTRARLRITPATPVGTAYRFDFQLRITKDNRISKRARSSKTLADIIEYTTPTVKAVTPVNN